MLRCANTNGNNNNKKGQKYFVLVEAEDQLLSFNAQFCGQRLENSQLLGGGDGARLIQKTPF